MRWLLSIACLPALALAEEKTGTFVTPLAAHSPLTSPGELAKRFPKADVPTYDLSQEPFLIHVPADYTAATAYGLVVLLNYKDNDQLPPLWPPVLAKHHLIYAMDTHHDHPEPAIAALSADAVYNLSQTYNIDVNRVYVVGTNGAELTALAYSDVFTGGLFWNHLAYFRPIVEPKTRGSYPAALIKPLGSSLAVAKNRPYVVASRPDIDDATATYHALLVAAFHADGFRFVRAAKITQDDFHYPNLTTGWLEEAVTFFECHPPTTRPIETGTAVVSATTRKATTKPVLSEPQRLLALANVFINHKAYPPARERLETIIKNFPDDPAAKEAQALLDTINKNPAHTFEWKNGSTSAHE